MDILIIFLLSNFNRNKSHPYILNHLLFILIYNIQKKHHIYNTLCKIAFNYIILFIMLTNHIQNLTQFNNIDITEPVTSISPISTYSFPDSSDFINNTMNNNMSNLFINTNQQAAFVSYGNFSEDEDEETMYVLKRDGSLEEVSWDKIAKRLYKLSHGLGLNTKELSKRVISEVYNKIPSSEIDELAAGMCAAKIANHPNYGILASRIIISNHHKNTSPSFSETIQMLWDNKDVHGNNCPVINERLYKMTMDNKEKINSTIDYSKDYLLDYFGFKTLERAYFLKANGRIVERYQHLLMRVALGIHKNDLREALHSYKLMSEGYFTHATPTLFNVGTQHEQAFSCFLLQMQDDSIRGIYKTITDCALISKWAGGIGVAIHKIRAKGSEIRGTQGTSNGIVPMLKNFNETARYVDQGGGKRNGSFAMYLEPWHADIIDFLMLRRNTGAETQRARDLFYAMWIPDLFMKRVKNNEDWTLMCPDQCPGLNECYGDEFEALYTRYEKEGRGMRTIKAQEVWNTILESQIENGMPYIGFKDAVNRKSNQKNLGTIQSSNLCIEIVEYTSPEEHAVCCLLSVALPKFLESNPFVTAARDITHGNKLQIYGKTGCSRCTLAQSMLENRGIPYEYINLDNMEDTQRETTLEWLSSQLNTTNNSDNKPTMECENDACKLVLPKAKRAPVALPVIVFVKTNTANDSTTTTETIIGGIHDLEQSLLPVYNFEKLREVTKMAVRNLNKLIDYNYYPVPETETSNRRHRPIGIGVQGLADVFAQLKIPFDSDDAIALNRRISEHMYLAAVEASMEIARRRKPFVQQYRRLLKRQTKGEDLTDEETNTINRLQEEHFIYPDEVEKLPMGLAGAYSTFVGSPASEGQLQFDLWGVKPSDELAEEWSKLKVDIKKHGLRNSLLMARMPTASTSQILGNNECMEPYTNNIYSRKVLAGEFIIINKHLVRDLIDYGLWSQEMKDRIILAGGSIQQIMEIPSEIRNRYRTVWEMKQKYLVNHAAAAGPFICQTQSTNLFVNNPTFEKINKMHFYSWRAGLKTGVYYTRTRAKTSGNKFAVDASVTAAHTKSRTSNTHSDEPNSNVAVTHDTSHVIDNETARREAVKRAEEQIKAQAAASDDGCLACSA